MTRRCDNCKSFFTAPGIDSKCRARPPQALSVATRNDRDELAWLGWCAFPTTLPGWCCDLHRYSVSKLVRNWWHKSPQQQT